jgi:arginyl-tRNA synthetase
MLKEKIKKLVEDSLFCLKDDSCKAPEKIEIVVKYPPKEEYGDYSVILREDLAKEVLEKINRKKPSFLEKVEFLPPSFLNFYIKKDYLQKEILKILKEKENFGKLNIGKKKKVNVEFISANPTANLHIGNGRGAFFGDVLANVLSFSGFKVVKEYYVNDAKNSNQIIELGKTGCGDGKAYLTEDLKLKIKKHKAKIKKILQKAETKEEAYKEVGYLLAKEILKDIKDFAEKKLKIKFDGWFFEQKDLIEKGEIEKTLNLLKKKNLLYQKEGALWLKTSKYGDSQDWVIVRQNGQPTYFLSDIAYHKNKIERGFKKIINIWGADHQGHVRKMKAAMKALGYKGDFEILITQIVNLKGGEKMSKRKGNIIFLEDLINEVGLDVARYFYISKSLSSQIEFDLNLAKEHSEKNPVYYIQYSYVRAQSIIKKAKIKVNKQANLNLLNHPSEIRLIKKLLKFPEIIEDTSKDFQIHRLAEYGKDLASVFNQFYRDCRVILDNSRIKTNKNRMFEGNQRLYDKNLRNLMEARLSLVLATKIVFSILLSLIGISTPQKM